MVVPGWCPGSVPELPHPGAHSPVTGPGSRAGRRVVPLARTGSARAFGTRPRGPLAQPQRAPPWVPRQRSSPRTTTSTTPGTIQASYCGRGPSARPGDPRTDGGIPRVRGQKSRTRTREMSPAARKGPRRRRMSPSAVRAASTGARAAGAGWVLVLLGCGPCVLGADQVSKAAWMSRSATKDSSCLEDTKGTA